MVGRVHRDFAGEKRDILMVWLVSLFNGISTFF